MGWLKVIYLAANNTGVFKLRDQGYPVGMIMSPKGLRKPCRGENEVPYAFDNGLFRPPDETPAEPHDRLGVVMMMARAIYEQWPVPMFVVVPDVPYDGEASAVVSEYWRPFFRSAFPDVPLAIAVQDGMTSEVLDGYDWAFVAGSTDWKLSTAPYWRRETEKLGKQAHLARVNTNRRLQMARNWGYDAADGTGIWRGDKNQKKGVLDELVQDLFDFPEPAKALFDGATGETP